MGASDSKLVFKQGIFKLSENKNIPADDPYWRSFWELPESAEDIFSLISPTDVRRIRDESLSNLETLILALTSRLITLRHSPDFPSPETAPELDALNCIRILTRLLPFIYEVESLEKWEETFFWSKRRVRTDKSKSSVLFDGEDTRTPTEEPRSEQPEFTETRPLAHELIDTLIDLLFFDDFTLPAAPQQSSKVRLAIWQSGVGCNSSVGTTKELESNRMEVLRLLLALSSKSMYTSQSVLPVQGIPAITYLSTLTDKRLVLTILCSLLNTALKYNPATWHVPYDHVVFKDNKQIFVTHCLQLLLVLVLYPVPETSDGIPPRNSFRHFLGKLHRPQDFQFLVDGMTKILSQPLQATSSYLPGSQRPVGWAPEMIMLFWEVLQCNKRFRSFIIDTDRSHDFVVLVLYHAISNRHDASRQGIVRMCVFVLQTLSTEPSFGPSLNKVFVGQDSLPVAIRIPNFHGTYADFLIVSIHTLLTTGKGKLEAVHPALLAIINNVAPHIREISNTASTSLLQLFATMSSPDYILANESNHMLLKSLMEAVNAIVENQHDQNPHFLLAIYRARKRIIALRDMMVNGGEEMLTTHAQRRKELAEQESLSNSRRQSLSDSLRSPTTARGSALSDVPEANDTFTIGDDDDEEESDEESMSRAPSQGINRKASMQSTVSAASSATEDAVPTQLRGMSEKARGKMPASRPTFSRTNSNASLTSMSMSIAYANGSFEPNEAWLHGWLTELPIQTMLSVIEHLEPKLQPLGQITSAEAARVIHSIPIEGIEVSPVRVHLFEWSPLAIGWYESLLWSFVYVSELAMAKGAPGVWRGTNIKLFRIQETSNPGPTLASPRGAVDAVGSNLMQRLGGLSLSSGGGGATANTSPRLQQGQSGRMRDV